MSPRSGLGVGATKESVDLRSKFPLEELNRLHPFLSRFFGILNQEVPEFPVFSIVKGMSHVLVEME
jgi:hypothetical protein